MARLIFMTDFSESYARGLLQGILNYSRHCEPWVVCRMPLSFRATNGIEGVVDFALRWKADAIIGQFHDSDDVGLFKENGIIAISQDFQSKFLSIPRIAGEYLASGRMCADYFIRRGYRNFAFYGLKGMVWSDERKEGFCDEILSRTSNASVSVQEGLSLSDTWWYDMTGLGRWLESLPKPVAIMACDDNRAYHILEACQHAKRIRIPEDVSVLGIDNDESICLLSSPQISSLNQNTEQAGFETAKMIDEALALPPSQRFDCLHDIVAMATFITARGSTGAFVHKNEVLMKVMTYINRNTDKNISVCEIADVSNMSRRSLETLFKREIGTSIYQYVLDVKVEKMTELLRAGLSVQETAQALGYDDSKSMCRTFKAKTGMTPSEFISMSVEKQAFFL